jgi:hypothetical protein
MKACVVGFAAMFLAACTSTSNGTFASVGGTYTGTVVNDSNTCPAPWNKGMMSSATVTIVQIGANVTLQMGAFAGDTLETIFGTNVFSGTVSGNHIAATLIGTVRATSGGCIFTTNGDLAANLGGSALSGDIIYTPQTNGHPDCAAIVTGCSSHQTFGVNRLR